jgi:hypothetical protein
VTSTATATRTPILTLTPTRTPLTIGAEITTFGVARADGRAVSPIGVDINGNPVFVRPATGFLIFIEARPGESRLPVATATFNWSPTDPNVLPDLQIFSSLALGNGSPTVCDLGPDVVGGVPAVNPPAFGGSQSASNAINDLSCRFDARADSQACTRDRSGVYDFVHPETTVQFCTTAGVGNELRFPVGNTYLTVRVRDVLGQPGHPATIVIRVL